MPNEAFNIMPTIKFSTRSAKMTGDAVKRPENCPTTKRSKSMDKPLSQSRNAKVDTKSSVLRHMCEYCGYRTRIGCNLKVHRRRHTGEKPFYCEICKARFVARYQLTTHCERHKDDQQRRSRYVCKECNVGFLSARALYHHKPLHAAVKQYNCTLCGKSYAQAAGYAQHKRWHRQQNRPFTAIMKLKGTAMRSMLKQCLINVDFSRLHAKQQLRPKCGEIFYEGDNEYCSFQLVCCLCEMKHFAFEDFSMHIRNVHFDKHGKPRTTTAAVQSDSIKPELQTATEVFVSDGNELLSEDNSDEDDERADPDTVTFESMRVCSFNEVKLEPASNENELLEENFQSEDDLDAGLLPSEDLSDIDDDADSCVETQSVFKKHQVKEYKCNHCAGKYTTLKYLNIHLKMSHPHPNGFKCDDCNATFDVNRALETHRRKVHTEFSCNLCDKVYKSSRTLMRHVQGHSGLRQFKCEFENCGKSFVSQHNLASHRRIHSTDRNYVCELCGYRSRYRDALIVHRRTHTGEKPFKCQTCARCFASKSLLNEHQAMHSTERPYKCDKCEAAFSRPKALYHHKHLHLGIKKFKCKICGNAYAQAAGLSAHMRGHKAQAVNGVLDCGLSATCQPY